MAPAKMLLLPTLLVCLLLLMVPSHCKVDPTSTTPEISQASSTICGITTGLLQYRRLQCPKFRKSANSTAIVPSLLNTLPGACVPDETSCSSGVYPDSGYMCGGSGVICKKSDTDTRKPCNFCRAIIEWLQDVSESIWDTLCKWWFAYGITGTVYCIVFVVCCLCIWLCYHHCFWLWYLCCCTKDDSIGHFGFNEIITMTDSFKTPLFEENFSTVFRGLSYEIPVAVKKFKAESKRAFNTELQILSRIRYQYIISLIGYCTENNEPILIFELMHRENLDCHLHPRSQEFTRSEIYLSWRMRVKVLLQVAIGIGYLHLNAEPRIIHRDITAENILINDDWVPRISNFGLAVLAHPGSDYVELEQVVGTDGYMDPECNADNPHANPRNDVYSFGVVMLEVVTGQLAFDERTGEKLADSAAAKILSGQTKELLDKRLDLKADHELAAVSTVAMLATQCVRLPGIERPDMSIVVTELTHALALFDPPEANTS